ncbi:hypothetical protein RJT34_12835 [Clitoria ternatea]|uniref:Reverse transcriptase/retrotransposon-derived protein RNase H-like domain-containing protein n=1 Tax=Clitoria ternatea TaxID=43366 RepID=A0AAN9JMY7_CLITE
MLPVTLRFESKIEERCTHATKQRTYVLVQQAKDKEEPFFFDPDINLVERRLLKEKKLRDQARMENRRVTLGDYSRPTDKGMQSSIPRPPIATNNFELKPTLLQLVTNDQFGESEVEDPNLHLARFLQIYDTVKMNGVPGEAIRLRSIKYPHGMLEDLLVKVDKFIFPTDFVMLDMEADKKIPLILRRPFLATGRALIDVEKSKFMLRVQEEQVVFNVFNVMKHPAKTLDCFMIEEISNYKTPMLLKAEEEALKAFPEHDFDSESEELNEEEIKMLNLLEKEVVRMPFRLCNALATFQRCMLAIFGNMVEKFIKEKFHFMVKGGIVIGYKISAEGITVDCAKIEMIEKLPPPVYVKGVGSFLGYIGFYHRFIKDFYRITKPLTDFLMKDAPFIFSKHYSMAFASLKEKLISAPILAAPDWSSPFKLMCDTSDFAVGVVLGQKNDKLTHVIYYESKVLNEAQVNYTTTEKEMPVVVLEGDQLSHLEGDAEIIPIKEEFPNESLMRIEKSPWKLEGSLEFEVPSPLFFLFSYDPIPLLEDHGCLLVEIAFRIMWQSFRSVHLVTALPSSENSLDQYYSLWPNLAQASERLAQARRVASWTSLMRASLDEVLDIFRPSEWPVVGSLAQASVCGIRHWSIFDRASGWPWEASPERASIGNHTNGISLKRDILAQARSMSDA